MRAAKAELDETEAELGRIHLAPELVAAEAEIKKLFQQLEQVASCRRDIPLADARGRDRPEPDLWRH